MVKVAKLSVWQTFFLLVTATDRRELSVIDGIGLVIGIRKATTEGANDFSPNGGIVLGYGDHARQGEKLIIIRAARGGIGYVDATGIR